ncbi:hypothetical protein VTK26DRAFT_4310 [Humicola hyalothermophila]
MPPRCANAPATANLFIQLSMRRQTVLSRIPILDLLLPSPPRVLGSPSVRSCRSISRVTGHSGARSTTAPFLESRSPRRWRGGLLARSASTPQHLSARAFSTSSARKATHTLFNPQMDEDGQEMVVEITPRAAKRLSEIMVKDSNPNLALRVQVESGGCHGFQYLMKLVSLPPSLPTPDSAAPADDSSEGIRKDDTIFTYRADDSSETPGLTAPKIILDLPSLELLKGSKVDFTMELIGSQFKIVDNPKATSSCGCGTSFDIKI